MMRLIILFSSFLISFGFLPNQVLNYQSKFFPKLTMNDDVIRDKVKPEFKFVGDTPPLGFFDPLGFTSTPDKQKIMMLREAELHHGRIAMISSVVLPILDIVTRGPAINALRFSDTKTQLFFVWFIAMYEANRILTIYDSPFNADTRFKLKDDAVPGQYYNSDELSVDLMNKELNNGRLAMIGALGFIAQELVQQKAIFE